ncbi:hypothetical protein MC885_009071 [Smutsia gigantea]|nr:hypothetical protein MC885_009071 [Smutsia gigantea]
MFRCTHGQNGVLHAPGQTVKPRFLTQGMALPLMGRQVSSSGSFPSLPGTMNMDWMSALCPQLWGVPIHHLSIPGSHDILLEQEIISHDQSCLLQLLDKVLRPGVMK